MIAKEEDDEIVLQILFVFRHLLGHPTTQQKVMALPGELFCAECVWSVVNGVVQNRLCRVFGGSLVRSKH
jgi:hypothetical protein